MQTTINIDGDTPLIGDVKLSGAKNSALKLIPTAMLSNDDIIIENVPRVQSVIRYAEVINEMGGRADWVGEHKLLLNGSGLNTFEVPYSFGLEYRVASLLAVPLVFRFGKALIPRPISKVGPRPINRWIDTWWALGFYVVEDERYVRVESGNPRGANINFKISTHSGTDNAIISSLFAPGETVISNAAEESEVEDLIKFVNMMGGAVERVEPRKIKVVGKNIFKGGRFELQSDKNEAVIFSAAAVLTGGNINIRNVDKIYMTSFMNTITKMGCKYEFFKDELRVWSDGEHLLPINITSSPSPGFMTDWLPFATLMLTQADGSSIVHDTVYTDRLDFTKDLNRMGARIELCRPSDVGLAPVISDDSYDPQSMGEPYTVARINGPAKLRGTKFNINEPNSGTALLVAALSAEGRSDIGGIENINSLHENILDRFSSLGARII